MTFAFEDASDKPSSTAKVMEVNQARLQVHFCAVKGCFLFIFAFLPLAALLPFKPAKPKPDSQSRWGSDMVWTAHRRADPRAAELG